MGQNQSDFEFILESLLNKSEDIYLNPKNPQSSANINNAQILFIDSVLTKATKTQKFKSALIQKRFLNLEQTAALKFMEAHGAQLRAAFSEDELRTEWKKLAFKFHPDTSVVKNLARVDFSKLSQAFHSLKCAFKPDQQAA